MRISAIAGFDFRDSQHILWWLHTRLSSNFQPHFARVTRTVLKTAHSDRVLRFVYPRFGMLDFGFVSDFGFRISSFTLPPPVEMSAELLPRPMQHHPKIALRDVQLFADLAVWAFFDLVKLEHLSDARG